MAGWHAKATGGYTRTSKEGTDNANMMCVALLDEGWSLSSVCAMLGNGAGESGLNPWRWESDDVPTVAEFQSWTSEQARSHGYGIFSFTPADKYVNSVNASQFSKWYGPNFSDRKGKASDGEAQTRYFIQTVASAWSHNLHDYYYDNFDEIGVNIDLFYDMTFDEFISGYRNGAEIPLAYLVGAFELCYEKPADWAAASSYQTRCENAVYWLTYFRETPPTPFIPTKKKMPLWMMMWWY